MCSNNSNHAKEVSTGNVALNRDENGAIHTVIECVQQRLLALDLHVHSQLSDGADSIVDIIDQAKRLKLSGFALSDHDTLLTFDALYKVDTYAREQNVRIWPALEVSSCDPETNKVVHLLAYGISYKPDHVYTEWLESLIAKTRAQRYDNALWQIDKLKERGYRISVEQVENIAKCAATLYKQHIMAALTSAPYGSDEYKCLYANFFKKGSGVLYREVRYPDFREVVRAIKEAGGFPVLAHPGQSGSFVFIEELVRAGLKGIERNHPDHTSAHQKTADELCEKYDLLATGGSDYHGAYGRRPSMGKTLVPAEQVSNVLAMLELGEAYGAHV